MKSTKDIPIIIASQKKGVIPASRIEASKIAFHPHWARFGKFNVYDTEREANKTFGGIIKTHVHNIRVGHKPHAWRIREWQKGKPKRVVRKFSAKTLLRIAGKQKHREARKRRGWV